MDGQEMPLPAWDEWGEKFMKGLKLAIILFVWSLPLLIILIPVGIGSSIAESGGDTAQVIGGLLSACFGCLAAIYGILLALLLPAIYIRFAETWEISSGFQIGEILRLTRDNIGNIIIAWIILIIVGIVSDLIGTLLCVIGILFTTIWYMLVQSHLFGQIGRLARGESAVGEAGESL